MVTVWAAMVTAPVRVMPGLASKLKTTFVPPVPFWKAGLKCSQVLVVAAGAGAPPPGSRGLLIYRALLYRPRSNQGILGPPTAADYFRATTRVLGSQSRNQRGLARAP